MTPSPPTSSESALSAAIIEAVATDMGVDHTELPEKLYEVIDTDSIDSLFARRDPMGGTVTFTYCDYTVTVDADGDVTLEQ